MMCILLHNGMQLCILCQGDYPGMQRHIGVVLLQNWFVLLNLGKTYSLAGVSW